METSFGSFYIYLLTAFNSFLTLFNNLGIVWRHSLYFLCVNNSGQRLHPVTFFDILKYLEPV